MSSFYCVKCGLDAFGKCCHCRSVYSSHPDKTVNMIEQVMSHRLLLDDPTKLKFKLYSEETWADGLLHLRDLLKDQPDDVLRIFACTHEWDFTPCCKSEIECGHRSEEKPLLDYLSDAWYYLNDGIDAETSRYPRGDSHDVEAAGIIHEALTAIDAGEEWDYKTWKGGK